MTELTGQLQLPTDPEERLRVLYLQQLKRIQSQKYREYVPNGKAQSFIQMVGNGNHFINLFIAANGVGKTAVLCNVLANLFFQPVIPWFNYPMYIKWPYITDARIISDTATVTKTIVPELHKWFPQGQYEAKRGDKHYDSMWYTHSPVKPPFQFDIMTYEQDLKQFESKTLGLAVFDEPPPESIWKATVSRLRRGGLLICCFTPLEGSAFFYDNYVTSPDVVRYT